MSQYVDALNAMKNMDEHEPKMIGDQWRTPEWLFQAINKLYGPIVLDLFTDGQNAKCQRFFTAEDNALRQDWAKRLAEIQVENLGLPGFDDPYRIQGWAYANPPYSQKRAGKEHLTGMTHIMRKADEERAKGAGTIWLTKSATSESWWPDTIATRTIFIKGRIGFEPPVWFRPKEGSSEITSAGFGAAIHIFDPATDRIHPNEYIDRETLLEIGAPLANVSAKIRNRWIKMWDEI
ncbi:phage N-6-adenine-methyltransferase [Salmonella enterica subsp. enterica serovar Bareilly]|uniref:N-6-adenine-methyltransferase n=1 Tax=Salmonella phage iEPS5 TaxID=2991860 RepID=R9XMS3_9CAUD|nr:phosphoadenosine phosphosulfate reductase [Salmonella phage iEPS5]EBF9184830.1 phage N-6-adenine-methyltransferase [Salmonella enterica]EBR9759312.1 phage N-6-adenine-methyltransferase [Salmonella enterica subsp. enterica serovar Abony]EBV3045086.1 phage N-6-adenine-methyltransferase [Salmonella enterica subsp. enterica serovar Typhimurium]EDX6493358.1 phage N-6-adenine-methyltransferase [Salmonella enterica subsp. enterica serovar Hadar]EEA4671752.1 phage N-6-adenine-methyltransferase [Sal